MLTTPRKLLFILLLQLAGFGAAVAADTPQNTSPLEAVQALQQYTAAISASAADASTSWISTFNSEDARQFMTYTEDGKDQFVMLGALTPDGSVDHTMHEKLFFLVNDAGVLQIMQTAASKGSTPELDAQIQAYTFRVVIHATVLEFYLHSLEQNIVQDTLSQVLQGKAGAAEEILKETQRGYMERLQMFASNNAFFEQQINAVINNRTLPVIPVLPVALGNLLDEHSDLLSIYMTKDMGTQIRNWLAEQQAQGMQGSVTP